MNARKQLTAQLEAVCRNKVKCHVAAAMGLSASRLNEYLSGDADPRLANVQRVVNFTGKPITIMPEVK